MLQYLQRGLHCPADRRSRAHLLWLGRSGCTCASARGVEKHRLRHRLPPHVFLRHGEFNLVGDPDAHVVPGGWAEVGSRGHRNAQFVLPHRGLGHSRRQDHRHPHHAVGGRWRPFWDVLRGQPELRCAHWIRSCSAIYVLGNRDAVYCRRLGCAVQDPLEFAKGRDEDGQARAADGKNWRVFSALHGAGHLRHCVLLLRNLQLGWLSPVGKGFVHGGRDAADFYVSAGGNHVRNVGLVRQNASHVAAMFPPTRAHWAKQSRQTDRQRLGQTGQRQRDGCVIKRKKRHPCSTIVRSLFREMFLRWSYTGRTWCSSFFRVNMHYVKLSLKCLRFCGWATQPILGNVVLYSSAFSAVYLATRHSCRNAYETC